jgi:hypothetical protein
MDDIYDVVKAIRILTQRTDDLFKAAFKICSKFGPILSDCKYSIACHYMKSGQSACMFRISQGFPWCQDGRYIADSTTNSLRIGKDDITNFLMALIFPSLLERYMHF